MGRFLSVGGIVARCSNTILEVVRVMLSSVTQTLAVPSPLNPGSRAPVSKQPAPELALSACEVGREVVGTEVVGTEVVGVGVVGVGTVGVKVVVAEMFGAEGVDGRGCTELAVSGIVNGLPITGHRRVVSPHYLMRVGSGTKSLAFF